MRLEITAGADVGKSVQLQSNEITIGRDPSCDLVINDAKASRRHAQLRPLPDGRVTLADLGSRNGTFVNGQRVQSVVLTGNERVQIGDTVMSASPDGAGAGAVGAAGAAAAGAAAASAPAPPPPQQQPAPQQQQQGPPTPQPPPVPGAGYPAGQQQPYPTQPLPAQGAGGQQPPPGQPPPAAFQQPSRRPVSRPSRTQSAIQRLKLQKAVNRATIVGVTAIVLILIVAVLGIAGVFSGGGGGSSDDVATAVDKTTPSTVLVVNSAGAGSGGRGTGWVWDAGKGLIVTNAHVTHGAEQLTVNQGDHVDIQASDTGDITAGPGARSAELKGEAMCEDIAVLQVSDHGGLKTIPRYGGKLRIGQRVVGVGYPASLTAAANPSFDATLTGNAGVISEPHTTFPAIPGEGGETGPYQDVIQTDTAINEGNSGGPLVNLSGQLVGMNTAKNKENVGQNYAISVDRINKIVPKLVNGESLC